MKKRNTPIAAVLAVALTSATLYGCSDEQQAAAQGGQQQAVPVEALTIKTQSVEIQNELPGRTSAYRVAEVRPQVSGVLLERKFVEGTKVEKGQQLYQIDPAIYQAEVASAQADFESAKAALKVSELRQKRLKELLADKAVSQDEFDSAEATYLQNKAALALAEAQLKRAKINLEYTKVKAPITGIVGRSNVTEGALVTASQSTPLVTINQLDPIYVDINQSSREFLELKAEIESGRIEANKNGNAPVSLSLNGLDYQTQGELLFSEVSVDQDTGAILLRAEFPNPENNLYPGMFVRAKVSEGTLNNAILVPQEAVTRDVRGRPYVMLINDENKVEQRMVTTARAIDNEWLISDGLNAGDRIVTAGLQKIRPGAQVTVSQGQQPASK
ncbi:efflux RND transporter periplasmic adaptor subunit [Idiomarina baltica]|uniref:MexE family multidrug efflux RND transporter periplasmic adaptor subunit n=3 Tax=Idiomarina TaxID=135575 RepID=A0A348WMF7_9GAMM|nr:efflux RND transporter periplasmic adaptor subunit [Idiomarina baltica]MBL73500.1 MexE family multidrug efflux RND transporter periplasmic adaptor subunit [Idiomarinaceae bacterium]MBR37977.1 MexE family multidrug efflux RND transporter periplasmic adaptor subunit [Idiomarina sp.]EAQ32011.1 Probable acriflavine resistance protein A, RND family efflux system component [Idiomarina baltica OS145]HAE89490.1 MexE family multidrug efflux RND transporter periplasmic adaptor subunit [Idiomarina sp.]|tara:strand:+ start:16 stop:1176 length:1161 start_codon:yes stop_codon:yes gene_type:complete